MDWLNMEFLSALAAIVSIDLVLAGDNAIVIATVAKMITSEPYLKEWLAEHSFAIPLLYTTIVGGELWAGYVKNHRRMELQINARISDFASRTLRIKGSRVPEGDSP